jgi:hypothetical protein
MAQQTAVDWLANELPQIDWSDPFWKLKLEQAKAMEKEQMYQVWETSEDWSDGKLLDSKKSFEEYYNEKYPNGKKN